MIGYANEIKAVNETAFNKMQEQRKKDIIIAVDSISLRNFMIMELSKKGYSITKKTPQTKD